MVTPASLARLRQQLEEAAREFGRPTPAVAVWLPCAADPGEEATRQLLHAVVGYLAAPGYADMMTEAGFGELVQFARSRPHPRELLAATPPELARAIGLVGAGSDIERRLDAYRAAGADEVCLVPTTAGDPGGQRTLEAMRRYLPGSPRPDPP
jgi:alkanesulfonate monooxygenase SsuD/methylene tetrahydromethanopterin reductase-like flavin-dependent oxidoreductase (luciferase family)